MAYDSPKGSLIKQMLRGTGFTPYRKALSGVTPEQAVKRAAGSPHSVAEVLAHMNFWQAWTLSAVKGKFQPLPQQAALGWPEVSAEAWPQLVEAFLGGLEEAVAMTDDAELLARPVIVSKKSSTWLDEHSVGSALTEVVAFHNAHHLGQIILLRRMLASWPPEGGGLTCLALDQSQLKPYFSQQARKDSLCP